MAVESHQKAFSEIKFRTESPRTGLSYPSEYGWRWGAREILNGRNCMGSAGCFRELDLQDLGNRSVFRQPQKKWLWNSSRNHRVSGSARELYPKGKTDSREPRCFLLPRVFLCQDNLGHLGWITESPLAQRCVLNSWEHSAGCLLVGGGQKGAIWHQGRRAPKEPLFGALQNNTPRTD